MGAALEGQRRMEAELLEALSREAIYIILYYIILYYIILYYITILYYSTALAAPRRSRDWSLSEPAGPGSRPGRAGPADL